MKKTRKTSRPDVYQIVTDRIIERLEEGVVPWRQPWIGGEPPKNFISKKPYRGLNVVLLGSAGFASPWWVTFKQAKSLGGHVRKGEKATPIVFWSKLPKKTGELDENGQPIREEVFVLRYFSVFNAQQIEGVDFPEPEGFREFTPLESAEAIVRNLPEPAPKLLTGDRASYCRPTDEVKMPPAESFATEAHYYATLFHELAHATGHEARVGRSWSHAETDEAKRKEAYAREELLAEMSAAFLCNLTGIETEEVFENSASYLQSWLRALRNDKKLLVKAAGGAQKAVDWIVGDAFTIEEESEVSEPATAAA